MSDIKKIGLISGSGQFPVIFSQVARFRGYRVYAAAHLNETDEILSNYVEQIEWVHLGQVRRLLNFFRKHGIDQAVMMGGIQKTRMFRDIRPDTKALSLIAGLKHTNDDWLLRAFADFMEKEGIRIRSATFLLPHLLAPEGCWTRRKPNRAEKADIEVGWRIAKEIGRLDIGQCVVVSSGSVLAVEAIDGTDSTIQRGGRLGNGSGVVVKVCKPDQDTRFDVPAIGAQTIQTMSEAGVGVLVVEAGKAVVFDREEMVELADRYKISIVALPGKPGNG